ncbi:MAG TPA: hypothetical protein VGD62_08865 [Acidobacteriaceae bacterium]
MQVTQVPYSLFLIFTIAVVISVLIQAGVFLGLFLVARKAITKAEALSTDVVGKATPILAQTRTVLEDLSPKIRLISANLVEVSNTLRDQTKHVNSTVTEVVDKTRTQAARVDEMVSAVLDGVTHATETIQQGVSKPVRQVSGLFQGFRATVESYLGKRKPPAPTTYYRSSTATATSQPLAADPLADTLAEDIARSR